MSNSPSSAHPKGPAATLRESGSLIAALGASTTNQVEIRRGMRVQTVEGHTVGHVAAVLLDQAQQRVTHLLLVQERKQLEYRLVPVELIEQAENETIRLRTAQDVIDNLPPWHSSGYGQEVL